jgi:hypothetical protein
MSNKLKLRVALLLTALFAVGLCIYSFSLTKLAWQEYDDARLAAFARQIDSADHIVATFKSGSVSLIIAGEDAKKVVRAVSLSKSHRPPSGSKWKIYYSVNAAFLRGTNVLGDIEICSQAFVIYHDQSPFQDDTGLLKAIVYEPTSDAYFKEREGK